jgi:hypothetical protein
VAGTVTISAGGTPPSVTPILSTNANYNQQPPFHTSLRGAQHVAHAIEAAAQVSTLPTTSGVCPSGTQTLSHQCHVLSIAAGAVITLPTNVSTPSLATLGIVPGEWWDVINNGNANITFTGSTGGTVGLSSSQFVIPAQDQNNFGSNIPSGCRIALADNTGIYMAVACTPNVVTPYPIQVTLTPSANVTSLTCNTANCTINGGTVTVVGGTFTTGLFATLTWSALPVTRKCSVIPQGTAPTLGITHSVATTTGFTLSAASSITGATFTFDYTCQRP